VQYGTVSVEIFGGRCSFGKVDRGSWIDQIGRALEEVGCQGRKVQNNHENEARGQV